MEYRFFDIEVLPNWYAVVIGDETNDKNKMAVITSDNVNASNLLKLIFDNENYCYVGYNIKRYDLIILNAIIKGCSTNLLYKLNRFLITNDILEQQRILNSTCIDLYNKRYNVKYYQDLMDDNVGSLKEKEAVLGLSIEESKVNFDKEYLTEEDKQDLIYYCKQDVYATTEYFNNYYKSYVNAKLDVGNLFNIPIDIVYKSTNPSLVGEILTRNNYIKRFNDENNTKINLHNKIKNYVEENVEKEVLDYLLDIDNNIYTNTNEDKIIGNCYYYKDCNKYQFNVYKYNNKFVLGRGGIHSIYGYTKHFNTIKELKEFDKEIATIEEFNESKANPRSRKFKKYETYEDYETEFEQNHLKRYYIKNDDKYMLMNIDAGSYYPSTMIQLDTLSRQAISKDMFKEIFETRMSIKHKENPTKEDNRKQKALKLVLNSTYGASGNKYLKLYDNYKRLETCIYGQLLLFALCNKLAKIEDLKIIQTNTDGILIYFKRIDLDKIRLLEEEWMKITGILLEEDMVEKIWQRDVNNYIMYINEHNKIKIKSKGSYFQTSSSNIQDKHITSLRANIINKAYINKLTNNIDIKETILNGIKENKDLLDYCYTTKITSCYNYCKDSNNNELLKHNRIIVVKENGISLKKIKIDENDNEQTSKFANVPNNCMILNNDINSYNLEDIKNKIDYNYYIQETIFKINRKFFNIDIDN